jgi:hypothetical protein
VAAGVIGVLVFPGAISGGGTDSGGASEEDHGGMKHSCSRTLDVGFGGYDYEASSVAWVRGNKYDVVLRSDSGRLLGRCAVRMTEESSFVRRGRW